VSRLGNPTDGLIDDVSSDIMEKFGEMNLFVDIMYVNWVPFLVTISRHLQYGMAEHLANRQADTVAKAFQRVIWLYVQWGFAIGVIKADLEFQALENEIPGVRFNLAAQNEHVPMVERYIRTIKDRARSCYSRLPFSRIPKQIIIYLIYNTIFWLNTFPGSDGVSKILSPRYIMTGRHLDYHHQVFMEFGEYVQTHKDHTNDMEPQTIGAICMGPLGNEQGGHFFLSLMTGKQLMLHRWTTLPMPQDAIERINEMGQLQGMPRQLAFAN